jgi:hypothetical protein
MFQTMTEPLPSWLAQALSQPPPSPPPPALTQQQIAQIKQQDMLDLFEALFEPAIDALSGGTSITKFLSEDHREPHPGRFMRWIKSDPERYQKYLEARDIAAELISNDIVGIADGTDNPLEDVARSKLRVDARKVMMSFDNKERFTTTTKVDVTSTSISITAALEKANTRLRLITPISADPSPTTLIEEAVVKTLPQPDPSDPSPDEEED